MRSEQGVILSVIVLAVLSIVFGVMAYMNYSAIDPGDDPAKKLDTRIDARRKHITELREGVGGVNEYQIKKERLTEDIAKQQQLAAYFSAQREAYVQGY